MLNHLKYSVLVAVYVTNHQNMVSVLCHSVIQDISFFLFFMEGNFNLQNEVAYCINLFWILEHSLRPEPCLTSSNTILF